MNVWSLKKMLYRICNQGYADWIPYFCDEEGDSYTINHIYLDSDGDLCLKSTDWEENTYNFTVANILRRLKKYDSDLYVYFLEEFDGGGTYACDIEWKWHEGECGEGNVLYIDCHGDDEEDDEEEENDDDDDGDPCLNRDNPWEVPCYRWGYSPSYSELEEEYERRYKKQRN